jgi:Uma2 family endonuclease
MPLTATPFPATSIVYPESDGKRLADNTKQARWIVVLYGNLCALFHDRPDVFVAPDNFWYPKEGFPNLGQAPDVYVVFGRPKGDRPSYKQWEEDNVPLTVVFEILSPGNTIWEMADKLAFYDEHGIEEYYIYDPDNNRLAVYQRGREALHRIWKTDGFVSPRLGIRFDLSGPEMVIYHPNGRHFLTFEELEAERLQAEQRAENAEQRAEKAEQRADEAQRRAARLAELSRKARRGQASADELQELERLEEGAGQSAGDANP